MEKNNEVENKIRESHKNYGYTENNNELKRTQGEWVIGYGHTSNCLGIFTKKMIDEGIKDNTI